jgi:hypothetical protein
MATTLDVDLHPLAALHLGNFNEVNMQLDINWFRGDVEQKEVVHFKRSANSVDLNVPGRRKRARS